MEQDVSNENQRGLNHTCKITLAGPGMDFQHEISESTAQKFISIITAEPKIKKTTDKSKFFGLGTTINESVKRYAQQY